MILFAAKSEKNVQGAIMLVILIKTYLHLFKVALVFSSKILLSRCVDYLIKGIKKLFPAAMLRYIITWEFLRTIKKCERHVSSVLKNSQVIL